MSAPEYVPTAPSAGGAALRLPPIPRQSQRVKRPAELGARPFTPGPQQGRTGPDAGYAVTLARRWETAVKLADGEDVADALAAGAAIAMTRAAAAGLGPTDTDVEVGLSLLGYLGGAPDDLVAWRSQALHLIADDYQRLRRLVDVPDAVLLMEPAVLRAGLADWRTLLPGWAAVDRDPFRCGPTPAGAAPAETEQPKPVASHHALDQRSVISRRPRWRLVRHRPERAAS